MSVRQVSLTNDTSGFSPDIFESGLITFSNYPPGKLIIQVSTAQTRVNGILQKYDCRFGGVRVRNYDELIAQPGV